jgi:hypothetical protein
MVCLPQWFRHARIATISDRPDTNIFFGNFTGRHPNLSALCELEWRGFQMVHIKALTALKIKQSL